MAEETKSNTTSPGGVAKGVCASFRPCAPPLQVLCTRCRKPESVHELVPLLQVKLLTIPGHTVLQQQQQPSSGQGVEVVKYLARSVRESLGTDPRWDQEVLLFTTEDGQYEWDGLTPVSILYTDFPHAAVMQAWHDQATDVVVVPFACPMEEVKELLKRRLGVSSDRAIDTVDTQDSRRVYMNDTAEIFMGISSVAINIRPLWQP